MTQSTYCQALLRMREKTPTLFEFSREEFWKYLVVNGLIASAGVLLLLGTTFSSLGWLLIGMGLGSFLRDLGWKRTLSRQWPWAHETIDWARVEARARGGDPT